MIDVAHDRDHRRPRLHRLVGVGGLDEAGLDVAFGDALELVAHLRHHQLGGVGVDRLVDGRHHAHAHERLDDVTATLGHALRKLLHGDGLGDGDLAEHLLLRLVAAFAAAFALEAAALLRDRTAAEIVLARDGAADVDLVRTTLRRLAARTRGLYRTLRRRERRAHRRTTQRACRAGRR